MKRLLLLLAACSGGNASKPTASEEAPRIVHAARGQVSDRVLVTGRLDSTSSEELRVPRTDAWWDSLTANAWCCVVVATTPAHVPADEAAAAARGFARRPDVEREFFPAGDVAMVACRSAWQDEAHENACADTLPGGGLFQPPPP